MTHARQIATAHPAEDFAFICHAAKNNEEKKLVEFLQQKAVSIDCLDDHGMFTPGGKLARAKNRKACELLMRLGANVSHIAMGAASVGDSQFAEDLRKKQGARMDMIAKGAAMYSDTSYAVALYEKYEIRFAPFLEGASYAGNFAFIDQVKNWIEPKNGVDPCEIKHLICLYAVLGGHEEYVKNTFKEKGELNLYLTRDAMALGAAQRGSEKLVRELYASLSTLSNSGIIKRTALGGHIDQALQFIATHSIDTDFRYVIQGAACAGHFASVEPFKEFFADDFDIHLLTGAIEGKQPFVFKKNKTDPIWKKIHRTLGTVNFNAKSDLNYLAQLISHGFFDEKFFLAFICGKLTTLESLQSAELTLHTLSFINDEEFLLKLANEFTKTKNDIIENGRKLLKNPYLSADEILTNHFAKQPHLLQFNTLVKQAIKIKKLMSVYDFNYDQALVFLKSKELRELLITFPVTTTMFPKSVLAEICHHWFDLSINDAQDMITKFSLSKLKIILNHDLQKYYNHATSATHKKSAQILMDGLSQIQTKKELKSIIKFQLRLFDRAAITNEKDDYPEIIKKHGEKLGIKNS